MTGLRMLSIRSEILSAFKPVTDGAIFQAIFPVKKVSNAIFVVTICKQGACFF